MRRRVSRRSSTYRIRSLTYKTCTPWKAARRKVKKRISRSPTARCISTRRLSLPVISARKCAAKCVRTSTRVTPKLSSRTSIFTLAKIMTMWSKFHSRTSKNWGRLKTHLPKNRARKKQEAVIPLDLSKLNSSPTSKYTWATKHLRKIAFK